LISFLKKLIASEAILYLFFGACVTLLNLAIYRGLLVINMQYWLANFIAMIITKLVAYLTNKVFVFKSKSANLKVLLMEFFRFVLARGFTGLIDFFGLIFMVETLGINEIISKYVVMVIVIILNFILGKKLVFLIS